MILVQSIQEFANILPGKRKKIIKMKPLVCGAEGVLSGENATWLADTSIPRNKKRKRKNKDQEQKNSCARVLNLGPLQKMAKMQTSSSDTSPKILATCLMLNADPKTRLLALRHMRY